MQPFSAVITVFFLILSSILPGRVFLAPLEETDMQFTAGNYTLSFNETAGTFGAAKNGVTLFAHARCAYRREGRLITSEAYSTFDVTESRTEDGAALTIRMQGDALWDLTQTFLFNDGTDWFTTRVTLESPDGVATNYIAPLVITEKDLQNFNYRWTNVLEVPFDNDGWVQFEVKNLDDTTASYEVGAIFNPNGGGLILGSLEHDRWKSAVATAGARTKLTDLRLSCGVVDPRQGTEPHGTITGEQVSSPLMFLGVFDDWQAGLNTFAHANTAIQPKRAAVTDAVPFGWNSWGSVQSDLNYEIAVKTSDYLKDSLQPVWQTEGEPVYVNLDSWWDMLSDDELKQFVDHCHKNGQKAGIYTAPFVMWWDDYGMSVNYVPGTDNTVTYQEIRLKKSDGTFYGNELDGCLPLDVTHPATMLHAKHQIDRFKAAGFDYIKLDFLVHAALEGDFYDPAIQTGIEAYHSAMTRLTAMIGDEMFIHLAMSPTFPYQFANGRRLACDAYYGIGDTEYTLNAVTYGFWEQALYDFTDPDHLVVWGKDAGASEAEARSRVTSGVIAGTSFLAGDNFVNPAGDPAAAFARYASVLTNPAIIATAKTGKIFTPVITNVKHRTANIYKLEAEGKTYIAVFNFTEKPQFFTVDTGRRCFSATELWSGKTTGGLKYLTLSLAGKDAALFEVTESN